MLRFQKVTQFLWRFESKRLSPASGLTYFLAPFAGGGPGAFHALIQALDSGHDDIYLLNYPRNFSLSAQDILSIQDLSELIASEIIMMPVDRIVLFGHSFGGVLSYEIALRLQNKGKEIQDLIVSSAIPPCIADYSEQKLVNMNSEAWIGELKKNDCLGDEVYVHEELLAYSISSLRQDMICLAKNSIHAEKINGFVSIFGGGEDPGVSVEQLQQWKNLGHFKQWTLFPGGHFYYQNQVSEVIQEMKNIVGSSHCQ